MVRAVNIRGQSRFHNSNHFRGCLMGGAIGDALGMPVEGKTRQQIKQLPGGMVTGFVAHPQGKLKAGQWTDDTALTLATVDSLLREQALNPGKIALQLREAFQKERGRGYGQSVIGSMTRLMKGKHWTESGMDISSNGAAMRISPIALFGYQDLDQLKRNTQLVASITHNNKEAVAGALAVAYVIARIINGTFAANKILAETREFVGPSLVADNLEITEETLGAPSSDLEKDVAMIGTSGQAADTVGISLFFFLRFPHSFEKAVTQSVSFGGDTDTIGGITGAFSGAYHGLEGIPQQLIAGTEAHGNILKKAEALWRLSQGIGSGKS